MKQLLLLRHAKATWDDRHMPDHSRPLNPRGRLAAHRMRDMMRGLGLGADLVLVSSARRTLQTLQSLSPWIEPNAVEPMDALYLASAPAILNILRQVTPVMKSVLVIGHNPGLHELALALAGPAVADPAIVGGAALAERFPTMGLAQFSVEGNWDTISAKQTKLRLFLSPKSLPDENFFGSN